MKNRIWQRAQTVLVICFCWGSAETFAAGWPAKVFAPYAYIPKDYINITDCLAQTGQKYFTLAFVIGDPDGLPAWDGAHDLRVGNNYYGDQIQALRAAGGDVLISFGGAGGSELALKTTNAGALRDKYQAVIDQYQLTWMDFDIEGKALGNTNANHRRNLAIKQLQSKTPRLKISFTLPVNPRGMLEESLVLLRDAKTQGVKIESVNIMTMDYGTNISRGKKMGDLAIAAAEASHRQTRAIDRSIKIGITPMIGQNDQKGEVFNLDDANAVMKFAKKTAWVRSVAFWSSNRDKSKSAKKGSNHISGIEQSDWDFTKTFETLSH